jgi:light-regulated signal transduction histidine kinase (bacteriophytochrome)
MQRLLEALLDYSRVSTRAAAPARVHSAVALEQALANLRLSIEETRATVDRGELPPVVADHNQLIELFQNLVANAIKFRGDDPPRIVVGARRSGDSWEFSVADNGIGIDPRHAARIFEVFQRLHTQSEYPGTGIGLAICRRIVERLGGKLWVESAPGSGSTFYFTLPSRPT